MQIDIKYSFKFTFWEDPILKIIFKYNNHLFHKKYNLLWGDDWLDKSLEDFDSEKYKNDSLKFYNFYSPDDKLEIISTIISQIGLENVMKNCVIQTIQDYKKVHKTQKEYKDSVTYLKSLRTKKWQYSTIEIDDEKLNIE